MDAAKIEPYREQRISKGQERFISLYGAMYKDLYRFAYYTLRSVHDAEDVVSEAVVDAFSGFHTLKDEKKFKAWIFKILSVKCKRKLKEYAERTLDLQEQTSFKGADYAENAALQSAFDALSKEERLIVSMSVFGGYSSKEISRILKLNANTVRSKLSRALEKMRKELDDVYDEEKGAL